MRKMVGGRRSVGWMVLQRQTLKVSSTFEYIKQDGGGGGGARTQTRTRKGSALEVGQITKYGICEPKKFSLFCFVTKRTFELFWVNYMHRIEILVMSLASPSRPELNLHSGKKTSAACNAGSGALCPGRSHSPLLLFLLLYCSLFDYL